MAMKELDEILEDVAEHRFQLMRVCRIGDISVKEDDELLNRFLRTFFPEGHKEYF